MERKPPPPPPKRVLVSKYGKGTYNSHTLSHLWGAAAATAAGGGAGHSLSVMVLLMHRCPMQSPGLALGPRAGLSPKTKIVLSPCKKIEMAFAQKKNQKTNL